MRTLLALVTLRCDWVPFLPPTWPDMRVQSVEFHARLTPTSPWVRVVLLRT